LPFSGDFAPQAGKRNPLLCCWQNKPKKGGSMTVKTCELAGWIDTDVIAEHIFDELEEQGVEPTLENAQAVWLDFLETELCQSLQSVIRAKFHLG
jgi:hypothetical protein